MFILIQKKREQNEDGLELCYPLLYFQPEGTETPALPTSKVALSSFLLIAELKPT